MVCACGDTSVLGSDLNTKCKYAKPSQNGRVYREKTLKVMLRFDNKVLFFLEISTLCSF